MSKDIAIVTENDEYISYDSLMEHMDEFNKNIQSERNLIIIMASNTVGSITGYLSCLKYKNVPIMLRDNLETGQLEKYISDYNVNYVWLPEKWLREKENYLSERYEEVYLKYGYVLLKISDIKVCMNSELALLLTTSGTTGSRKLVRLSYGNIESNTKSICKYLEISDKDKAITSLPMSYTYGLSVINTHLYSRATVLLTNKQIYTKEFWEYFKKNGGTSFSGVPYMYEMLIKLGMLNNDIETLGVMTVAGGKLSINDEKHLLEYAQKYNKKLIVMYGQTEATARISYRPYEDMNRKIGSIGIAIPGGSMWLENQKGDMVNKPYNNGEIIYKGENVSMGYACNYMDLMKGNTNRGVLHTGDIGYIDEDGYFYILDRCDGSIKVNGHRLDLKDMERMLREKYPDIEIQCRSEKCYDRYIDKKIKIDIKPKKKMYIDKLEMKTFIKDNTGVNPGTINITII